MKNAIASAQALLYFLALLLLGGCHSQAEAPQCDTAPAPAPAVKTVPVPDKKPAPDADWCRVCVMGPKGFASCQRVYAQTKEESRDTVRQRSLDKACQDAGFSQGSCPKGAIIAEGCKGDPPKAGVKDAGQALQDLYLGTKGPKGPKPQADKTAAPAAKEEPKPKPATHPPVI
ncbi:MAG: hypothetical protein MUC50_12575 [Myxococcota bacterium]|jgi:hypothetical protein|nr:hypothetical protein [Myxococcota bacterium]